MTRARLFSRFACIAMLAAAVQLSSPHAAYGQGGTGSIKGIVTDPSGALVPGATVKAVSGETGTTRSTVTNADGSFLIPLLEPAHYAVHITASSFEELVRGPVTVKVTETADLGPLPLTVGASDESVTVTEQEGLLQNENATLGKVFDAKAIEAMPLSTRNFSQLLSLQAGVIGPIPNTLVLGNGTTQFSVGGGRVYDNSITIDGINAVSSSSTGAFPVPSPDALDEFKMQTSNYTAEYSRAGGGNIAVTTKSGSSKFHGDGFYFVRNKAFDANDYFLKQGQAANDEPNEAPDLKQNQYGGTVGGPAIPNRAFFFFSYQSTKQSNGNAGLINNPAYPYLPAGDRSNASAYAALLGACYGGQKGLFGGTAVATNGSNINPVALALLQAKNADGSYVLPSFPRQDLVGQPCTSHAIFNIVPTYTENQYVGNVDYTLSANHMLTVKFFDAHNAFDSDNASVPGFHSITPGVYDLASVKHTFVVTPTLVNELIVGYMRQYTNGHETVPTGLSAQSTGMIAAPDSQGFFPQWVMISNGLTIQGRSLALNAENQYSISDSASDVIGRHVLHFGGVAMEHQLTLDSSGTWGSGAIITDQTADFLLGMNAAQNGSPLGIGNLLVTAGNTGQFRKDFRFNDYGVFVQDDWQFLPKMTLNLGVRWDYYAWPSDQKGRLDNFDRSLIGEGQFGIPTVAQGYTGYTIAQKFIDTNPNFHIPSGVTSVNNQDGATANYKNFAPRVGFAWTPVRNIDIRGGFGLFFSRTSSLLAQSLISGPPFNNSDLYAAGPAGTEQDPFTHLALPPDSAFPSWPARSYTPGGTPSLLFNAVSDKLGNPYTEQWNLSVQQQLGKDYLFELAYQGQNGVKLLEALSQNQAGLASVATPIRGITTNTVANVQDRSPVAGLVSDEGLAVSQTSASSHFNALEATLDKRFNRGLQFISAFTWSRSEDSDSIGLGAVGSGAVPPNDNDTTHHGSLSAYDRTLRFTTSAVYDVPDPIKNANSFFTGALKHGLSGWGMAGVLVAQTGPPTSFSINATACACSAIKSQGVLTASLAPGKTLQDVKGSGKTINRLTNYFNTPKLYDAVNGPCSNMASALRCPVPTGFGGTATYTPIRAPGQKSVDFSLTKNTSIREKYTFELRGDFYNFFNWVNFAAPDSSPIDATFGQITATSVAPRVIQLAGKFKF